MNQTKKKEYIEVNGFIEAIAHLATYQSGERQQGILGVLASLKAWPRVDLTEPEISVSGN